MNSEQAQSATNGMKNYEGANGNGLEDYNARETTQLDAKNSQTQLNADASTHVAGSALISTLKDYQDEMMRNKVDDEQQIDEQKVIDSSSMRAE